MSHYNSGKERWEVLHHKGIPAVIHKATEGVDLPDCKYQGRIHAARSSGLLVGAYHWGTNSDVEAQVRAFLDAVRAEGSGRTLLALDFENYEPKNGRPNPNNMPIAKAIRFIKILKSETNVTPFLYTRSSYISETLQKARLSPEELSILHECPIWNSAYSRKPPSESHLQDWTFWQYSNHAGNDVNPKEVAHYRRFWNAFLYPRTVKGFNGEKYLEMNVFRGTRKELEALWDKHSWKH